MGYLGNLIPFCIDNTLHCMKLWTIFTLLLSSWSAFPVGVVRSLDPWEPQHIFIYENPDDPQRIIFEFCITKESKDKEESKKREECYKMVKEEGILGHLLQKETQFVEKYSGLVKNSRKVGPLLFILGFGILKAGNIGQALSKKGVPSAMTRPFDKVGKMGKDGAFVTGMGAEAGATALSGQDGSAADYWEDLELALDPEFGIRIGVIDFMDFTRVLEHTLVRLSGPCAEYPEGEACAQWVKEIKEGGEEMNRRYGISGGTLSLL